MAKRFMVTLDGSKCLSHTLPDGRKFFPNRPRPIPEENIAPFRSAGVFMIQEIVDVTPEQAEKAAAAAAKPKAKAGDVTTNPEEKDDDADEKSASKKSFKVKK